MNPDYYSHSHVADILGISKRTLSAWNASGKLIPEKVISGISSYHKSQLSCFHEFDAMFKSTWSNKRTPRSEVKHTVIELFAGAGGLSLGMEMAGFNSIMLNEFDKHACNTLRENRPDWKVVEGDVASIDFNKYKDKADVLAGGFPCQAFSYSGKRMGFEDTRGTLFFEFARAAKEIRPKVILAENVKGLISHDNGKTLETIKSVIDEIGYVLVEPRVLRAIFYRVPQKRERLIFVGIRKDLFQQAVFNWPQPYSRIMTLKDALYKGELFECDVPHSDGQSYPKRKAEIMNMVPQGGCWRDLPEHIQKEYMMKSYYLGGGKTGMARRLSMSDPSLTLTCAPAQKQTERCHPLETRPLTVREYARIQTFPDSWIFSGSVTSQYKQIGNAVPVNLGFAIGKSISELLDSIINGGQ